MLITGYVFLGLFILSFLAHLYFCFFEKEKLRQITKIIPVFLLAIMALFFLYDHPLIYFGALLGAAGDYFLIKKNHHISFFIGTILFFVGHLFYLVEMLSYFDWPSYAYPIFIGCLAIYLIAISLILYPKSKLIAGNVAYIGNAYGALIVVNLVVALILAIISSNLLGFLLIFVGYFLFIVSDTVLTYTTFIKDCKRRDFYIMLTYLSAQFLIVFSLCFILI